MTVFLYWWNPQQAASAWSVEVSYMCVYAQRVTKMALWHLFSLLISLLFLCPQISWIHLCIAQHVEFSTLCWKLKLNFAVSAWIFSLHLLPKEHPHIGYLRSRGEIKSEWLYLCEFLKNLGVSVLGIVPCSVSVEEMRPLGACKCAVGRWSPVLGWAEAQRLAFHVQLDPWKSVVHGCVLPSLHAAEDKKLFPCFWK